MRIKKIYFNRMYNQWRGEPLYVEDGLDDDKLYIRIMDVPDYKEGAINTITADYKDLNDGTYTILGQMDFDKRLAIFKIPLSILSNSGIYEVVFSLSFNAKDKEGLLLKTPIQTFEIVDTIESDDEAIAQDPNYPILVDLINQLAEYKVDTSIFPTREEMMKTIEENLNKTSMEEILKEVQANGYITLDKLNTILRNYASKADLSGYAKESDLNKFVTNLKFIQELDKYVLKTSMGNYVLKETGKGLSTHDLTDELYEKLVNLDMSNGEVNIDLTEYQKQTDDRLTTKDKTIVGSINEIKNSIPIKTSQLQNDSGYLTEHQDLSDYATKSELHNHDNKDILDNITQEKIDSWDNKSDFSGSYNDLTDKPIIPTIPDIPTKVSQLENDSNYATESFVTDKIIEANLGGNIDLSEYAKSSDIPTKVSQLDNDSEYVTKTYVENFISTDVRNILLENTFIDCLNEIANSFISDTIVFGNYVKYFYILRGRIRNLSDYVDLPITINNKEYDNVSYISMINTEYNFLTTFIFSNEGALRIETPYTPILDDGGMYIGITITEIGNVHELKGSYNGEITECHTHTNKDILDTITSTMINNWNNKSDVTINDDINNISTTQTYSNSMIENRLTEVGADITVISDDLDSIDARVTYLEGEQTKIGSFDGSYDSLTNKPTIPTKTSELTNDSGFTTKKYVDDNKFSKNYEDLNNEPFTFVPIKLTETNNSNGTITAYCDVFDLELGHRYVGDFTKYDGICLYTFNSDNTKNTLVATTAYLSTGRNGMITIMSSSATKREILWMSAFGSERITVTKNSDGTFTIANSLIVPRVTNTREFTPTSNYHLVHKKYVDDKVAGVNASTITGLSTVATSGDYNDLTNKPTIPSEYTLPTASATQLGGVKIGAGLSINNGVLSANGGGTADSGYPRFVNGTILAYVDEDNILERSEIQEKLIEALNYAGSSQPGVSTIPPDEMDSRIKNLALALNNVLIELRKTINISGDIFIPGGAVSFNLYVSSEYARISFITSNKYYMVNCYLSENHDYEEHSELMVSKSEVAEVALSGSYNDLTNRPTIPTVTNDLTNALKSNYDTAYTHSQSAHAPSNAEANVQADWNVTDTGSDAYIKNKPTIPAAYNHPATHPASMITGLANVATTGSYNDLSNKPTIPAAYTHPTTHPASMITGLAKVATSGSYNDLSNKPTIPTIPSSLPANGGNADTVNNFHLWKGTQAEYDAITTKDSNTIYMITG